MFEVDKDMVMPKKRCPHCGTECFKNYLGQLVCLNCGISPENTKIQDF